VNPAAFFNVAAQVVRMVATNSTLFILGLEPSIHAPEPWILGSRPRMTKERTHRG
jgi:hypothetical protein